MNGLQSRPLPTALLVSLGLHLLLLLPWKYGVPVGTGMLHGRLSTEENIRLDVVLRPASTANASLSDAVAQIAERPQETTPPSPVTPNETPSAAGVPMENLYYYASRELDQRPSLRREPEFDETPDTKLLANGSALLEILIERDGRINAVNIVRTDLLAVHITPLRKAFLAVEYAPGVKQGEAVRSRVYIEVSYVEGILSPVTEGFPQERTPHVPITLPPDWRKRKENPPLRGAS